MRVVRMNPFNSSPASLVAPPSVTSSPPAISDSFNIKNLKKDDWILLSVIAILLFEGCTDYILLCALGYLFFVGL